MDLVHISNIGGIKMICWDCGKEIDDTSAVYDQFSCDMCDVTLCRKCYGEQNGFCEECLSDIEE